MEDSKSAEVYTMNGGDGLYSYSKNSSYQRTVSDVAKLYVSRAIADKLDINHLSTPNTFWIADLGCSVGPNTFLVVQNIIDSVKLKYDQGQGTDPLGYQILEFQVLFNDHASNDFNTLFTSLPVDKQYHVAGVPGSFYSRLFPRESLHLVHSSFALHWLSKVPERLVDKSSPAWNKGRIHYSDASDEVVRAYSDQSATDMENFLNARAQEVVHGGLMAIVVPARPSHVPHSQAVANVVFEVLGSCLMDMAKEGVIDEEKVDSLNIPIYYRSPQELEVAISRNGSFTLERMESLPRVGVPETLTRAETLAPGIRAGIEGLFKEQFEDEIIEKLFELFRKKLEGGASSVLASGKSVNIFVVLKRNEH